MASLMSLPNELLDQIVKNSAIARCDLRSLRLTCRRFTVVSTPALFSRICLSRLWRDRIGFISISSTPHLAEHVRTLVFYEYAADLNTLRDLRSDDDELSHALIPHLARRVRSLVFYEYAADLKTLRDMKSDDDELYHDLMERAKAAYWLEPFDHIKFSSYEEGLAANKTSVDAFLPEFLPALRRFPLLSTLVSEPLCLRNHSYRLQPSVEGCRFIANDFWKEDQAPELCSLGAKMVLSEAMEDLDASATHRITTLRFTDEGWNGAFCGLPSGLFGKFLTTVDLTLRLDGSNYEGFVNSQWVVGACLRDGLAKCPDLQCLRLSFLTKGQTASFDFLPFMPVIPRLHELRLNGIKMDAKRLGLCLTKRAATVRHVLLQLPDPWGDDWDGSLFAENYPALQLETFILEYEQIWEDDAPQSPPYEPHWIHRRTTADSLPTLDEHPDPASFVRSRQVLPPNPVYHALSPEEAHSLDPAALEDSEDDIMLEMTESRPSQWFFAKHPDGKLYYRQADPDLEEGWPTEVWHFKHRNGEEAMGDEPLEFWSDWEGSEAGDLQQPTPFGKVYSHCFNDWEAGTGWEEEAARQTQLSKGSAGRQLDLVLQEAPEPIDVRHLAEPHWLERHETF